MTLHGHGSGWCFLGLAVGCRLCHRISDCSSVNACCLPIGAQTRPTNPHLLAQQTRRRTPREELSLPRLVRSVGLPPPRMRVEGKADSVQVLACCVVAVLVSSAPSLQLTVEGELYKMYGPGTPQCGVVLSEGEREGSRSASLALRGQLLAALSIGPSLYQRKPTKKRKEKRKEAAPTRRSETRNPYAEPLLADRLDSGGAGGIGSVASKFEQTNA